MGSNGLALGSEHSPASARFAEYYFNSGLFWHERHDLNRMSRWRQINWCWYWIKPTPRKKSCRVSQVYVLDPVQGLSSLRTIFHHSTFSLSKGQRTPTKKKKKRCIVGFLHFKDESPTSKDALLEELNKHLWESPWAGSPCPMSMPLTGLASPPNATPVVFRNLSICMAQV